MKCLKKPDDCNLALANRRIFDRIRRRNKVLFTFETYVCHCGIYVIKFPTIFMGESIFIYSLSKPTEAIGYIMVLQLSEDIVDIFINTFCVGISEDAVLVKKNSGEFGV